MRFSLEDFVFATITAGAASAAALTLFDAQANGAARAVDFQLLVRGLGLGAQPDLGHGVLSFDPRLRGNEPAVSPLAAFGVETCRWHRIALFPEPRPAAPVGQVEE